MKWIGCGLLIIMVAALLVLSNSSLRAQPDKMVLDSSKVLGQKQRPAVTFPHNHHVEIGLSCKDCHHFYQGGKNILDESKLEEGNQDIRCSACHDPKSRGILKQAFHDQCMGCHIRYQKEKKKTGPRYCGDCHIKKQRL
jgi:hypothetical protein